MNKNALSEHATCFQSGLSCDYFNGATQVIAALFQAVRTSTLDSPTEDTSALLPLELVQLDVNKQSEFSPKSLQPTLRSAPVQKLSRNTRFSTLPDPLFGKSAFENSTWRGTL